MAAGAAGITMGDAASHRTSPATDPGATTGGHWIDVFICRTSADRDCGLTSAAAETRRGTPHRIRPLKHGTTARRTSLFRMGFASRTGDVRSIRSSRGRLSCRPLPVALVLNDFLVPVKRWLLVWRVPVLSGLNPLWTDLNSAVAGFGAVHVWSRGRLPRGPTGRMR